MDCRKANEILLVSNSLVLVVQKMEFEEIDASDAQDHSCNNLMELMET